jgi:hypothetical protein
VLTSAAAVFAAVGVGSAAATNECRGLMVCVPVAGPWVVVPAGGGSARPQVEYQLSCPRGYIVGGLDAELSNRAIDIAFGGTLGSPVNPGITTDRAAVFSGRYVGSGARASSFRPHIGCIPTSGGGQRVPTSYQAFPPGKPTLRRVRTVSVHPGRSRLAFGCAAGERLVAASDAVGFFTVAPPGARLVDAVSVTRRVGNGRIAVSVAGSRALAGIRAIVQVSALCAGGR